MHERRKEEKEREGERRREGEEGKKGRWEIRQFLKEQLCSTTVETSYRGRAPMAREDVIDGHALPVA